MDAKLKSLKVVDLKDILAKAAVSAPAKANKQELIARIVASPQAIAVYNKQYPSKPPTDDLLAPPEDVDWDVDQINASELPPDSPVAPSKPAPAKPADKPSAPPPAPVPTTVPVTPKPTTTAVATVDPATSKPAAATNATPTDDAELERRKKRAERFGIPLVEPTKQKARPENKAANGTPKQTVSSDDSERLRARATRFGLNTKPATTAPPTGQKRTAPVEELDAEEKERRKRRAERFGSAVVGVSLLSEN